jgi:hypothetical protein
MPSGMQETGSNLLQLGESILTQDPQDAEELANRGIRDRVHHKAAALSRLHQSRSVQDLQVLRSVRNTHAGFFCQVFHRAFGLAQQVDQLQALGARDSSSNTGYLAIGVVFECALVSFRTIINYSIDCLIVALLFSIVKERFSSPGEYAWHFCPT